MPRQPDLFDDIDFKKHVGAVAVVPATRRITTLARKAYNVLLHLAQEQGSQEIYRAPLRDVMILADYDSSNNYQLVKQTLRQLVGTVVEWQSPSNGEIARWDACGLLAWSALEKHRSGSITVEWSYAPQIREQLLNPSRYARLSLDVIARMRTHAAIALYEICVRYIDNPSGLTARQPWLWWRPVLSGTPDFIKKTKKAPEYRNFKRDTLKPAIAEINALSEIEIEGPIEHKGPDNKTIVEIQFKVRRKRAAAEIEGRRPEPADLESIGRAINAGIKQAKAEELLDEFGRQSFLEGIEELERRKLMPVEKVGPVIDPSRWLRSRLSAKSKSAAVREGQGGSEPAVAPSIVPKQRQAKWIEEWLRRRRDTIRKEFDALPGEVQQRYIDQYRIHLASSGSPLLKRFENSGWSHKMLIHDFLRRYASDTWGEHWDRPEPDQILEIAAEIGDVTA